MRSLRDNPIYKRVRRLLTYKGVQYRSLEYRMRMADNFHTIGALTDSIPIIILQKPKEFVKLLSILRRNPPERILEIGTLRAEVLPEMPYFVVGSIMWMASVNS